VHDPHGSIPPQPSEIIPQLSGAGHTLRGTQVPPTQMSSCAGVADCWHVPPPVHVPLVAVHASQAPKSTFVLVVSQTDVAPLHPLPLSPHEHLRQFATVVPVQIGFAGPDTTHLFCLLLQSGCTTQLCPLTMMVGPALPSAQMSPISPQLLLLSPQPAGNA
jgi:hypothetical protein